MAKDAAALRSPVMSELLIEESDRGCILVASAYLEEALRVALMKRCKHLSDIGDVELTRLFKDFESQFSNFASCIRLARGIGIISADQQGMLLEFGAKRNAFAHGTGRKSITEKWIQGICRDELAEGTLALGKRLHEEMHGRPLPSAGIPRFRFMFWAASMQWQLSH